MPITSHYTNLMSILLTTACMTTHLYGMDKKEDAGQDIDVSINFVSGNHLTLSIQVMENKQEEQKWVPSLQSTILQDEAWSETDDEDPAASSSSLAEFEMGKEIAREAFLSLRTGHSTQEDFLATLNLINVRLSKLREVIGEESYAFIRQQHPLIPQSNDIPELASSLLNMWMNKQITDHEYYHNLSILGVNPDDIAEIIGEKVHLSIISSIQ